ncbi:putative kinetochore protein [Golovinomyces cichoracearum]|uniref:Putative kinetochore protein n=1 Tax=Golovinomyces cichoracearum TaxID=62708 RepID=A0A420J499_9PEZI|nr:putative kinetochore protein [Golovinomyces cichoracearum]
MTTTIPAPTIIELKAAFLRQQVHILSEPLQPSEDFYASRLSTQSTLRPKIVQAGLRKLNQRLKRHNQLAYGRKAQRHLAEQIDQLSWQTHSPKILSTKEHDGAWLEFGTDYCASEIIEQLPDEWPYDDDDGDDETRREKNNDRVEEEGGSEHFSLQKYVELRTKLAQLNTLRNSLQHRVANLKKLQNAVNLLNRPDEIQANLITRGGELEQELDRMCRLMLRVERGISASNLTTREPITGELSDLDQTDFDEYEESKVLKLIL